MKKWNTIHDFIKEQRALVTRDWDNLILFTGQERSGKSTVMFQVMKALDEDFDVSHCHYLLPEFLADARGIGKYRSVVWDEADLDSRDAMTADTKETLKFLRECGGLNLHIGLCFPHESQLDKAIKNNRVRWNIHILQRGLFVIRKRVSFKRRGTTVWDWKDIQQFRFQANKGPLWDAYKQKKQDHMEGLDLALTEEEGEGPLYADLNVDAALPVVEDIRAELVAATAG